ncbi:hypothetical protein AB6A40_007024 [Gnathostoma spinigerum]|uniref:VWFA domain-containing protein n=1 Tax=Gnathostoma spinigerum TaxID=75299 RepID=A0ABD6EK15_9BILA
MPFYGGITATGAALGLAIDVLKNRRPNVPTNVIVITDGFSYDIVDGPAAALHKIEGVYTSTVTITPTWRQYELETIAGNRTRIYKGNDSVPKLVEKITSCNNGTRVGELEDKDVGSPSRSPPGFEITHSTAVPTSKSTESRNISRPTTGYSSIPPKPEEQYGQNRTTNETISTSITTRSGAVSVENRSRTTQRPTQFPIMNQTSSSTRKLGPSQASSTQTTIGTKEVTAVSWSIEMVSKSNLEPKTTVEGSAVGETRKSTTSVPKVSLRTKIPPSSSSKKSTSTMLSSPRSTVVSSTSRRITSKSSKLTTETIPHRIKGSTPIMNNRTEQIFPMKSSPSTGRGGTSSKTEIEQPKIHRNRTEIKSKEIDAFQNCLLDVIIVIDASGSLRTRFQKELELSNRLVDRLKIGPHHARVAIIKYAGRKKSRVVIPLDKYAEKEPLMKALSRVRFMGGTTYTNEALEKVEKLIAKRNRTNSVPIVVVFTDGFSADDPASGAMALRDRNTLLYAVAVNHVHPVNENELLTIAGDASRVFLANNVDSFEREIDELTLGCRSLPST